MNRRRSEILLFDGDCGLCTRTVQVVLRADRKGTLRFASLQSPFARGLLAQHPELEGVDSIAWVESESPGVHRVRVRSDAVLRVARYLGFPWSVLRVGRLIPRGLRDRAYDWIARRRHRWFGAPVCALATPEELERLVS